MTGKLVGLPFRGAKYSETRRQIVHMAMGLIALLLPFLTWPQAALLALAALLFNFFALARVFPEIIRPADAGGHRAGVLFYPLSVLLLVLVFRERLDIVAAAWGVMAFGDGAATIAGTRVGGARLPWNPDKTWSGLAAFIMAGSVGAFALAVWVMPSTVTVFAVIAATIVAALVETIPIKLDDNLSVPFAAGAMLALFDVSDFEAIDARTLSVWPWAIGVNVVMALAAWMRGSLTLTGAAVGTVLGAVIYLARGPSSWALLFISFALAVLTSPIGKRRKQALGITEEHDGRRGAGNAIANCLVGAIGAWLMLVVPGALIGPVMLVTGLVAGASDTVASEIGKAYGRTPRAFPSFKPVPPGTPGAVSKAGTVAGLLAAIAMAVAGDYLLGLNAALYVVIGATLGAFVESALATRYESHGILNNDVLNFINTAVAATVAVLASQAITGRV